MRKLELKVPPLIVTLIFAVFIWVTPVPYKFRDNSTSNDKGEKLL